MTREAVGGDAKQRESEWVAGSAEERTGKVVVTGFEPFDGRVRNRSWDLVRRIDLDDNAERHRLPVDFVRIRETILGLLSSRPRALLMIGEAPTAHIRVEQVALNLADSDGPDNAGRMPHCERLVAGAPLALPGTWDARALAGRMHQEGIPAAVSFHAGTFACNAALFHALLATRTAGDGGPEYAATSVGFLHVPNSRGAAGLGSANLGRAVELAIEELKAIREEGPSSGLGRTVGVEA